MTDPAVAAIKSIQEIPTNGDPALELVKWVLLLVIGLLVLAAPLMFYVRKFSKDKADIATESVGVTLYQQLAEQVKEYRALAQESDKSKSELLIRVATLEARTEEFEDTKALLMRLKKKLDQKDEEIKGLLESGTEERRQFLHILTTKDSEIYARDMRIDLLEKTTRELAERVRKDEEGWVTCPLMGLSSSQREKVVNLIGESKSE